MSRKNFLLLRVRVCASPASCSPTLLPKLCRRSACVLIWPPASPPSRLSILIPDLFTPFPRRAFMRSPPAPVLHRSRSNCNANSSPAPSSDQYFPSFSRHTSFATVSSTLFSLSSISGMTAEDNASPIHRKDADNRQEVGVGLKVTHDLWTRHRQERKYRYLVGDSFAF